MRPYAGLGAGYAWSHLLGLVTTRANGLVSHLGGTDGGFAYQGIVGAAVPLPPIPNLAITLDYRFFGISGQEVFRGTAFSTRGYSVRSPVAITQNLNHSVVLGLRYSFGPP